MKRFGYISVWIALMVLVSTVFVAHFHHNNLICMLKEVCVIDGNFNDEHTPQHRNCDDDCPLFQIHHFTDNVSGSQKVCKPVLLQFFSSNALLSSDDAWLLSRFQSLVLFNPQTFLHGCDFYYTILWRGPPAV